MIKIIIGEERKRDNKERAKICKKVYDDVRLDYYQLCLVGNDDQTKKCRELLNDAKVELANLYADILKGL